MRWTIVDGPTDTGDAWNWIVNRGSRRQVVAVAKDDEITDAGRSLVVRHLDDNQPPSVVSLAPGWDFSRNEPTKADMGMYQLRGVRGEYVRLAHRLNLPHWLQPRP